MGWSYPNSFWEPH